MRTTRRASAARWARRLLIVMAGAALLGVVAPAQGAFPGRPGKIVFSSTFAGDREIFSATADGSGRVDLTRDPHADVTPSWSADGKRIVFASDRAGAMEIYVMNADGSGVAQVTHDGSFADHPRFTADGRSVVYESRKGGNWEIRRIGVDGGGGVDLTRNRASDRYPAMSPNGRLVAFASNRGSSGTHIWVMNIQGRSLKQVTLRKGNQFEPAWAPSGGRLAYVSGVLSAGTNIRTVLASGKDDHALTALHADVQVNPSWSPDGHSLLFQDCHVSLDIACTLSVMPVGGSPVGISALRAPLLDTFDTGNGRFWQPIQNGTGASSSEADGKLTTTIRADATQGGQYDLVGANWSTMSCGMVGDFDVQVEYQLLEWPGANGVQAALSAFGLSSSNPGWMAIRESQVWGEQYGAWIPQIFTSQPTGDLNGTLRLQREGGTAVSSYLSGGTWVPIASGPIWTDPALLNIGASSGSGRFVHQEVKIAWDNFRVNSGTIVCPPGSWEDDTPDWQAAP